jgi:hypothetical protein
MNLQQFKRFNNIGGLLVLLVATVVYTLTMESSVSLWDCGEFTASVYKQQVVHPPGAPMFLMLARLFSFLAMGKPELVSLSLNFMSAFCSGAAAMFLFWVTTHIARRMLTNMQDTTIDTDRAIAILGAGLVAGLTGTFLDAVWFSAVEAEVYSMSLMFTAMLVWLMMKWDEHADEPFADKWLLMSAFVMGVCIFVHWLNILTIPALTLIYYFRRYKATTTGSILALFAGIGILLFIYIPVILWIVGFAAWFELMFVNNFGLPFNSGALFFIVALIGSFAFALYYTYKNNHVVVYNMLLGVMFILIGYSTIVATVLRANTNPNINMNAPTDVVSLSSYLKREQYGSRPFLFGYDYTAEVSDVIETGDKYQRVGDRYEVVGKQIEYEYSGDKKFFPRLYSQEPGHKQLYEQWLGLSKDEAPSGSDNLKFFFRYQIGHMYLRYLLWNFVGRQNDEQGMGDIKDGNWISGIDFLDAIRLGNQSQLPDVVKNNPARNTYYFIPFLLGLLGMVFHFTTDKRRAWVVLMLFFFCGVAMIIQGNSPPIEPRERDYIFVGSFYAFAIWVGIGVIALYDMLKTKLSAQTGAVAALVLGLIAPAIMGYQNWDDHNRSNRFAARDFAANYLNSCAPNAIIFTQGDNDTYPLWYTQEVENIRRDVRVVNLSLLGVDWYINQLRRRVNDAAPVPMTMTPENIRGSRRDVTYYKANPSVIDPTQAVELKQLMGFIRSDQSALPERADINYFPTKNITFTVDKEKVLRSNALTPEAQTQMVDQLQFSLPEGKSSLYKNDLMILDIIAANNWERPIYFAVSVNNSSYMGLEKYFQLEGLAYRIVPVVSTGPNRGGIVGNVNPDIMYDNLMNKFKFGNLNSTQAHTDSDYRRMIYNFRGNFARLADELTKRGDTERALAILDQAEKMMPDHSAPHNIYSYTMIDAYYKAGAYDKGNKIIDIVANRANQDLLYIKSLNPNQRSAFDDDENMDGYFIESFVQKCRQAGQEDMAKKLEAMLPK